VGRGFSLPLKKKKRKEKSSLHFLKTIIKNIFTIKFYISILKEKT